MNKVQNALSNPLKDSSNKGKEGQEKQKLLLLRSRALKRSFDPVSKTAIAQFHEISETFGTDVIQLLIWWGPLIFILSPIQGFHFRDLLFQGIPKTWYPYNLSRVSARWSNLDDTGTGTGTGTGNRPLEKEFYSGEVTGDFGSSQGQSYNLTQLVVVDALDSISRGNCMEMKFGTLWNFYQKSRYIGFRAATTNSSYPLGGSLSSYKNRLQLRPGMPKDLFFVTPGQEKTHVNELDIFPGKLASPCLFATQQPSPSLHPEGKGSQLPIAPQFQRKSLPPYGTFALRLQEQADNKLAFTASKLVTGVFPLTEKRAPEAVAGISKSGNRESSSASGLSFSKPMSLDWPVTKIRMSGYSYPDMGIESLYNLNWRNSRRRQDNAKFEEIPKNLRVPIPVHPYFLDSSPINVTIPLIEPKYYRTKFKTLVQRRVYSGPAIRPDSKKNSCLAYNTQIVQNQYQFAFDVRNPNQKEQARFFGNTSYDSSLTLLDRRSFETTQMYQNWKQAMKRQGKSRKRLGRNSLQNWEFHRSFVGSKIPEQTWYKWLSSSLDGPRSLLDNFPVREVNSRLTDGFGYPLVSPRYELVDLNHLLWSLTPESFKQKTEQNNSVYVNESFSANATTHPIVNPYVTTFSNMLPQEESRKPEPGGFIAVPFLVVRLMNGMVCFIAESLPLPKLPMRNHVECLNVNSWQVIYQYIMACVGLVLLRQIIFVYGREVIAYIIDILAALGILDASLKEEFGIVDKPTGYRVLKKSDLYFANVAGIRPILSDISELVFFLKTPRLFCDEEEEALPKGILFVGPPGTGKTLLVQALAGEAGVPIFSQSAGDFQNVEEPEAGGAPQRLQKLFRKAKEQTPCIIFFDEIDSFGRKRGNFYEDSRGCSLFDILHPPSKPKTKQLPKMMSFPDSPELTSSSSSSLGTNEELDDVNTEETNSDSDSHDGNETLDSRSPEQLSLLVQLLIELDGVQQRERVIIVGATNRAEVLDPALIRPGRFDRIFKLGLPTKRHRIAICQLHFGNLSGTEKAQLGYVHGHGPYMLPRRSADTCQVNGNYPPIEMMSSFQTELPGLVNAEEGLLEQPYALSTSVSQGQGHYKGQDTQAYHQLGVEEKCLSDRIQSQFTLKQRLDWSYIAGRTFGFSGADLATIMNQSKLNAVIREIKCHTMTSLDAAIDQIVADKGDLHVQKIWDRSLTELAPPIFMRSSRKEELPTFRSPIDKENVARFAYYHSGSVITQLWLTEVGQFSERPLTCSLFPKHLNTRYTKIAHRVWSEQFVQMTRVQSEAQITHLISGKVAEALYFGRSVQGSNYQAWLSDFGQDDLQKAMDFIYFSLDKWHFYSRLSQRNSLFEFAPNQNHVEFDIDGSLGGESSMVKEFFGALTQKVYKDPDFMEHRRYYSYQARESKTWWQLSGRQRKARSRKENLRAKWFRIFVPGGLTSAIENEWLPADRHFHSDNTFFLIKNQYLGSINQSTRDEQCKRLIQVAVSAALRGFSNSSEFMDFFVSQLIRGGLLTQEEIKTYRKQFYRRTNLIIHN